MTLRSDRHRQTGFTLLEMMVALGVTLIVASAVFSLLQEAVQASGIIARRAEIQMNARSALNELTKDIGQAGTLFPSGGVTLPNGVGASAPRFACDTSAVPAPCYITNNGFSTIANNAASGQNQMYVINPEPAYGPNDMRGVASDTITVAYVDTALNLGKYPISALNAAGTSATFTVPGGQPYLDDTVVGLVNGDILLFTCPSGTAVAVVTSIAPIPSAVTANFAAADPLNFNVGAGIANSLGALIAKGNPTSSFTAVRVAMVTYFLQTQPDGSSRLVRQYNARPPVPVAENISQLQITYDTYNGTTLNASSANAIDPATSVSSPNEIRKVNLWVGVRSARPDEHGNYDNLTLGTSVSPRNLDFINRY